jgi:hypothetical protein
MLDVVIVVRKLPPNRWHVHDGVNNPTNRGKRCDFTLEPQEPSFTSNIRFHHHVRLYRSAEKGEVRTQRASDSAAPQGRHN